MALNPDSPSHDMNEIPEWKHPAWKDEKSRHRFEEDIRIHVYEAIDNLESDTISCEEKAMWRRVIASLGDVASYYKGRGFKIHIH